MKSSKLFSSIFRFLLKDLFDDSNLNYSDSLFLSSALDTFVEQFFVSFKVVTRRKEFYQFEANGFSFFLANYFLILFWAKTYLLWKNPKIRLKIQMSYAYWKYDLGILSSSFVDQDGTHFFWEKLFIGTLT